MFHVEQYFGRRRAQRGGLFHMEHFPAFKAREVELVPRGTNADRILISFA